MLVQKWSIWLPEEYGDFSFLLNTLGNCTKMSCFYWVLITIFNASIHIFQEELNADVKTASRIPLIQKQGFPPPPIIFSIFQNPHYAPKLHMAVRSHEKISEGVEGEQELYQSCIVISESPMKHRRQKQRFHEGLVHLGSQQWDATHLPNHLPLLDSLEVKTQLNKRFEGKFWSKCAMCSMSPPTLFPRWHSPPIQAPGWTQQLHPLLKGTRCSKSKGYPGGKGRKGWANETNTLEVTDLQIHHLLDSLWITKDILCKFRHDTSTHAQENQSPWIVFWSFPFFVLSGEAGIRVSLRLYPEMSSCVERGLFMILNVWCFTAFLA